jgi:hypothetical protein
MIHNTLVFQFVFLQLPSTYRQNNYLCMHVPYTDPRCPFDSLFLTVVRIVFFARNVRKSEKNGGDMFFVLYLV